ncbi:hypothetical protein [Methanoplanus endosymbiosus]|uniref:Uncharacterized protein n=1 Tax=Methanoplanus endosymbiosus TaxID=33865 RepID=A0A9E7TKV5_9EURY|nr:hypothetical protein [Methanoplanus endosymbiosus]UUX91636.1 hypothetical protein L6E24_09660 [Methanoplanus endosymbiosus]
MSEREVTVRQYGPFRMAYPQKAASYLALTNKRLILFAQNRSAAKDGKISLVAEMNIHDVKGIESKTLGAASLPGIIAGLLFIAGAAYLYLRPYSSAYALIEKITPPVLPAYILPAIIGIILIIIPTLLSKGRFEVRINEIPGENSNAILSKGVIFQDSKKISDIIGDIGAAVIKIQEENRESERSGYSGTNHKKYEYPAPFPAKTPDEISAVTEAKDAEDAEDVDDDYASAPGKRREEKTGIKAERSGSSPGRSSNNADTGYRKSVEEESEEAEEAEESEEAEDDYTESMEFLEEKKTEKDDYLF